jgi:predicted nucleic acid-binding protein
MPDEFIDINIVVYSLSKDEHKQQEKKSFSK